MQEVKMMQRRGQNDARNKPKKCKREAKIMQERGQIMQERSPNNGRKKPK